MTEYIELTSDQIQKYQNLLKERILPDIEHLREKLKNIEKTLKDGEDLLKYISMVRNNADEKLILIADIGAQVFAQSQ